MAWIYQWKSPHISSSFFFPFSTASHSWIYQWKSTFNTPILSPSILISLLSSPVPLPIRGSLLLHGRRGVSLGVDVLQPAEPGHQEVGGVPSVPGYAGRPGLPGSLVRQPADAVPVWRPGQVRVPQPHAQV